MASDQAGSDGAHPFLVVGVRVDAHLKNGRQRFSINKAARGNQRFVTSLDAPGRG